jgi:hypothetical protein
MKPLLLIAAMTAALAGACSDRLGTGNPPPPASTVTFELRNDGASAVYLFQNCLLNLTITSLADPVHVVEREGPCGCDCGFTSCPVCGPCYAGFREVAGGAMLSEYWNAVSVTYESAPTGSCERKHALPAGQYRIDVPVYASQDDATNGTGARTATQTFTLPAPDDTVGVALGVSP